GNDDPEAAGDGLDDEHGEGLTDSDLGGEPPGGGLGEAELAATSVATATARPAMSAIAVSSLLMAITSGTARGREESPLILRFPWTNQDKRDELASQVTQASHLSPALQGLRERDLVRVFKVPAHGEAAGESGHPDAHGLQQR